MTDDCTDIALTPRPYHLTPGFRTRRAGTLYSPLTRFLPISTVFFLSGLGYDTDTFSTAGRFTNGSALLLITLVLVFLIGLVFEQITQLLYARQSD